MFKLKVKTLAILLVTLSFLLLSCATKAPISKDMDLTKPSEPETRVAIEDETKNIKPPEHPEPTKKNTEISIEEFGKKYDIAIQNQDIVAIEQLIRKNPKTASEFKKIIEEAVLKSPPPPPNVKSGMLMASKWIEVGKVEMSPQKFSDVFFQALVSENAEVNLNNLIKDNPNTFIVAKSLLEFTFEIMGDKEIAVLGNKVLSGESQYINQLKELFLNLNSVSFSDIFKKMEGVNLSDEDALLLDSFVDLYDKKSRNPEQNIDVEITNLIQNNQDAFQRIYKLLNEMSNIVSGSQKLIFMQLADVIAQNLGLESAPKEQSDKRFISADDILNDPSKIIITINFATNKADILAESEPQLQELGKAIVQLEKFSFEIGGHTDQRGSDDINMRLSEQRAESVRQYLIRNFKIDSKRLIARGYGETLLFDPNDNEKAWAFNRRVEIISLGSSSAEPILTIEPGGHKSLIKKIIFTKDGKYLISAGEDKWIRVWDINKETTTRLLLGQKGNGNVGKIYDIAISPDEKILAAGGFFAEEDMLHTAMIGEIRLYDFTTGKIIGSLKGHSNTIFSLVFSPDGKILASASSDSTIRLWDIKTRKLSMVLQGHETAINQIAFSPDGKRIASVSDDITMRLWDVTTGKCIAIGKNHEQRIHSIAWDTKDRFIVTASADNTIMLWDSKNGSFIKVLAKEENMPFSLYFSSDGTKLLTGCSSSPYNACLYSIPEGEKIINFNEHNNSIGAVTISPDGKTAATGGGNNQEILIWNIETGKVMKRLEGVGGSIFSLGISKDGKEIAFGYKNPCPEEALCPEKFGTLEKTILIRSISDKWSIASGGTVTDESIFNRSKLTDGVYSIKQERNGEVITLVKDGNKIDEIKSSSIEIYPLSYTFTQDGNCIAVGGYNGSLKLLSTLGMKPVANFVGHEGAITSLTVSNDGKFLFSASSDQTICIWNIETRPKVDMNSVDEELIKTSLDYVKKLTGVAMTREQLLALCIDEKIPTYKIPKIYPLVTIFPGKNGEWIAWTKSGYYTASAHGDKYIGWHMNRGYDRTADWYGAEQFASTFYRPDIVSKTLEIGFEEQALKAINPNQQWIKPVDVVKHAPPEVKILSPNEGIMTKEKEVTLHFEINRQNDDAITNIVILVNGRPVNIRDILIKKQLKETESRTEKHEVKVPLSRGQNLIQVIAETKFAKSVPSGVTVVYETNSKILPRLFILSIGVSEYANKNYNLDFAHKDAEAIVDFFKSQHGKMYSEVNTNLLTNANATREKILEGLDWLGGMAQNDLAIVFMAGHGETSDQNHFYFLGYDANFEKLRATAVKWTEFKDTLTILPGKVILMADACHSGAATREGQRRDGSGIWNTDSLAREFTSAENGVVIFMASQGREFSLENQAWGHGAFTKALVEGLKGPADFDKDGLIHLSEIKTYVQRSVPKLTNNAQHPVISQPLTISDFPVGVK
ncbi:MAG: OmpA family protein [Desulfobacterales bacterium]|nr:OmpA family protein [Desulfobacterales bacterium]